MNAPTSLGLRRAIDGPVVFLRQEARVLIGVSVALHLVAALPGLLAVPWLDVNSLIDPVTGIDMQMLGLVAGATMAGALLGVPMAVAIFEACRLRLDGEPIETARLVHAATRPRLLVAMFIQAMAVMLGVFMCVVPGAMAAVLFAMWLPVLLHEDVDVFTGARRGIDVLKHRIGGTGVRAVWFVLVIFVVWLTWMLFVNTLGSVLSAAYSTWMAIDSASRGALSDPSALTAPWWLTTIVAVLTLLLRSVTDLFPTAAMLMLYRSVREEQEGHALLEQLRQRAVEGA